MIVVLVVMAVCALSLDLALDFPPAPSSHPSASSLSRACESWGRRVCVCMCMSDEPLRAVGAEVSVVVVVAVVLNVRVLQCMSMSTSMCVTQSFLLLLHARGVHQVVRHPREGVLRGRHRRLLSLPQR